MRDAASGTQGQQSPQAVHSGVPRGPGPPRADVSAHRAFLPVSSGVLLGQQGARWQDGWWGHGQPQATPGSGRGATGVGGAPGQAREEPPPKSHRTNRPPGAHSSSRPPRPSVFPIAASLPEPSRILPTRGLAWVSAKAGFCYRQDLIRSTSGWSQTWIGPLSLGPVTPAGTGEAGSPRAEGQSWPQDPQGAAPSRDREKPKGRHGRNARAASTASRRPLIIQLLTL